MFKMLKRIVLILIFLVLAYLLIVNAVLNVQATQNLINKIKPEKFQITWKKAWTPYPFKIYIEEGSAWGASSSRQWKVNIQKASASVSILPLFRHIVRVYDIDAVNVDYIQRPVKTDAEKAKIKTFFVPIRSNGSALMDRQKPVGKKQKSEKEKKAWRIDLDNIAAKGDHSFRIMQAKGDMHGDVHVKRLSIETKSGPFSVAGGRLDILMNRLQVGKEKEILSQSRIHGTVTIDPIVFSKDKGLKMLSHISFDTNITTQMGSLEVLNIYLHRLENANIAGKGKLDGHIIFQKGKLLQGTDMQIKAEALSLSMKQYTIDGDGKVSAKVSRDTPDILDAGVSFNRLKTYVYDANDTDDKILLFSGSGLTVAAKSGTSIYTKKKIPLTYFRVDIPDVSVDDLGVFQRYVPQKWAFKLYGGSGHLYFESVVERGETNLQARLRSSEAKVGFGKQTFETNMDLVLKFNIQRDKILKADLSGSYLSLKDSRIIGAKGQPNKDSINWDTHLNIDEGLFSIPVAIEGNLTKEALRGLDTDIKKLLSGADATLKVTGEISQFEWLNLLMKNSLNLTFSGHGRIESNLKLKQGMLEKGSTISLVPENLNIGLLEYIFSGDGYFSFIVTQGGMKPSLAFDAALKDASMKRRQEKTAMISDVVMKLSGELKDIDLKADQKEIDLHLQVSSAKVTNIAVYNSYIPENAPLKLVSGTADMHADIILSSNNAKGYVGLETHGLTMKVDDQKISARLNMDMKISSGVPKDMAFDISGSTITLDQAKVIGSTVQYKQSDWSAVVKLDRANVVWRKPIELQSQTSLKIKDSRPIVAMMDNKKEKHNWISKLMTIENINGKAMVNMANNVITIPNAYVKSDKIDIGAKGIISPTLRDGVFYLRFKGLKMLLKIRNGKKNLDIFHVEKTFDDYVIPKQ